MRGALPGETWRFKTTGLTPADGGSTCLHGGPCSSRRAHPRRCGEHRSPSAAPAKRVGSPPQMRGALSGISGVVRSLGLTPADAGSTKSPACRRRGRWAHPRRCGEHDIAAIAEVWHYGSPPQMRGAHPTTWTRAHPRRCGEHTEGRGLGGLGRGSPPQMRGALPHRGRGGRRRGLTPADAGSTPDGPHPTTWTRAHPRRCGEHLDDTPADGALYGSSPQMRGAPARTAGVTRSAGLIPPDAGSTESFSTQSTKRRAHPRRCGEHVLTYPS